MIEYFRRAKYLGTNVKIQLNLSNYATNAELKNGTVDISSFAKESDLANLKSDVD